ncbi:MAG: zinc-dependent alcohol dehydrogenase [Planctomycetota bacterium]|jgi:L-iditol 2-dehydrogenase
MKAIVLTGIRQLELRDIHEPKIEKENDVLLKMEAVGVCGSDTHYYETGRIGDQIIEYPFVFGHECSATVEAIGRGVERVKVGDSVVVDPAMNCNNCDQCNSGRPHTCRQLLFLGCPGESPGCLCEYIVMPQERCYPTKGRINSEQGVICEPLSIGIYSVQQADLMKGQTYAILGAGPIGLSCLLSAQAKGFKDCYMTEKIPERIRTAEQVSSRWVGNPDKCDVVEEILKMEPTGVDVVFECAGEQETIDQAVQILKPGGKLMLIGIPRTDTISVGIHTFRRKEGSLITVRRQNNCTQLAIDMIAEGKIDVDFMFTHRFDLKYTNQALELVTGYHDGVVKAIINI